MFRLQNQSNCHAAPRGRRRHTHRRPIDQHVCRAAQLDHQQCAADRAAAQPTYGCEADAPSRRLVRLSGAAGAFGERKV